MMLLPRTEPNAAPTASSDPLSREPELRAPGDGRPLLLFIVSLYALIIGLLVTLAGAHLTQGLHDLPGCGPTDQVSSAAT